MKYVECVLKIIFLFLSTATFSSFVLYYAVEDKVVHAILAGCFEDKRHKKMV